MNPAVDVATRFEHFVDTRSVRFGVWLTRLTKGQASWRVWHRRVLVLTTRGRRTGRTRTVLVQYFPDGDDFVVVAANSGMPSPPGWYFNLGADPLARVEAWGRTYWTEAEEMSPEEAAAFWPRVLEIAPDYGRYPRRAGGPIPLMRLRIKTASG